MLESEKHARSLAEAIQRITSDLGIPYIFKASYDKANRTSISSFRGPGLVEGARLLAAIAKDTGLPVLTDVHTPEDCPRISDALGAAESGVPLPADGSADCCGEDGASDQCEEGSVCGAARYAACGAEGARLG